MKEHEICDLREMNVVLVRFHYSNEKQVPQGLRSLERPDESLLVQKRMRTLGVSTEDATHGKQVIQNLQRVQAAMIRKGLVNNGFRLMDAHTLRQSHSGKTTKFITTLGFHRPVEGEVVPDISAEAQADLRNFASSAVYIAHVWVNPGGVVVIELMMRQPNVTPMHALVTEDGFLIAEPTEHAISEEEEIDRIRASARTDLQVF